MSPLKVAIAVTSTIGTLVLGTFMSLFAWLWWSNLTDPLRRKR